MTSLREEADAFIFMERPLGRISKDDLVNLLTRLTEDARQEGYREGLLKAKELAEEYFDKQLCYILGDMIDKELKAATVKESLTVQKEGK